MIKQFKIHILFSFQSGPAGGGNQFLKALKREFIEKGTYEENYKKAEVILFNSHHNFDEVFRTKARFPQKIFIHRIDGPIQLIRGRDKILDKTIYQFNKLVSDGIVFQSNWSREQNKKLYGIYSKYETVIHNAPDNEIFNREDKKGFNPKGKIKLIATSWSPNWRKGFEIYKFLDKNLDFSSHKMTFVGNSSVGFKNIKWIKPVSSERLTQILKEHDIYIIGSQNDPCSNSLIEALSCGLPVVALNNGGHPELLQRGGELFNGKEDVIEKIKKVAKNYQYYQSQIPEFSIEEVTQDYYEFAQKIYDGVQNEQYKPKLVNFLAKINFYKMKFMSFGWKAKNKLKAIKRET